MTQYSKLVVVALAAWGASQPVLPADPAPKGCPTDVSQADRYRYADCK